VPSLLRSSRCLHPVAGRVRPVLLNSKAGGTALRLTPLLLGPIFPCDGPLQDACLRDDAMVMLSGRSSTDGRLSEDDVFIVYPHRGFMMALGSACLVMGSACLIAAIVIIPSDPLGSLGATGIGSFFCLGAWFVFACKDSPQITVSERGVLLHRDGPLGRKLGRTRVAELAWSDIRTVDVEMRVKASSRYFLWGIVISFVLGDGKRKRHVAGLAGASTKRLLTEMKRFADMGECRIEWPSGLETNDAQPR